VAARGRGAGGSGDAAPQPAYGIAIGLVDWHLLVLFVGLFVLNEAVERAGVLTALSGGLDRAGIDLSKPAWLFAVTPVLSNLVSNVPAVMVLLPLADAGAGGPALALSSTFAGNLLVVGSIANIIVVERAASLGVVVDLADSRALGRADHAGDACRGRDLAVVASVIDPLGNVCSSCQMRVHVRA
jgi:hypothetical protein